MGRMRCISRGEKQLSTVFTNSIDALGNPFIAVLLGAGLAAGLLLTSRASFKLMNADNSSAGLALVAISLFARLAIATLSLWAYKSLSPEGLKPFALSLAGGFVVMYTVELVRYAGLHRLRRPARTRQ